ncbi:MAG: hypothetical protein HDT27_06710 [Subdoligranulum sp.]|nr:hypothetical protein [Subdoligranulum sp.]
MESKPSWQTDAEKIKSRENKKAEKTSRRENKKQRKQKEALEYESKGGTSAAQCGR